MKRSLILILTLLITALPSRADGLKNVIIVSDSWPNFVNAEEEGYYMHVLREVYPDNQYRLILQIMPYSRALKMTQSNQAHIVLGIWANEHPPQQTSKYPVEIDLIDAVVRKKQMLVQGPMGMNGLRVMSRVGYAFDELLDKPASYVEHADMTAMLNMLLNGRTDVILGFKTKILEDFNNLNTPAELKFVEDVLSEFVVFGFCSSTQCDQLRTRFDTRYEQLHRDGFIKRTMKANTQRTAATPPLTPINELIE